jgi:hypothetical protein
MLTAILLVSTRFARSLQTNAVVLLCGSLPWMSLGGGLI